MFFAVRFRKALQGIVMLALVAVVSGPASSARTARRRPEPATSPTTAPTQPAEGPGLCAHIRLGGEVLDSPPGFTLFGDDGRSTLQDWLHRLAAARSDAQVAAVALEIDSPFLSWAQAQELADALRRLRETKPVHVHMIAGGPMEYLVASAGNRLTLDPAGDLDITGLAAEVLFFRGTLDWIGVQPQLIQIGRFKGAEEPLSRTGPSEEFKQMYDRLLDDLYLQLCEQIARQRNRPLAAVKAAIDEGPLTAEDALKARLVDDLAPRAAWREQVCKTAAPRRLAWQENYGRKPRRTINLSNPFSLLGALLGGESEEPVRAPCIAIIHADGVLISGHSSEGLFGDRLAGDKTLAACFDQVAGDPRVKAVVFRINSPGGSALASELVWQAVQRCAGKKPVVASISAIGASGGYYVAVGAPTILADPSALVGSIGVIGGKLAITGLLEKLRIGTYEITRGKNAGLELSRPWTPQELEVVRRHAQRTYDLFLSRVRESRGSRIRDLDAVAEGRIFTGRQAAACGLVDRVGGLREAVQAAQEAAGIRDATFLTLPRPRTLLDLLAGDEEDVRAPFALEALRPEDALTGRQGLVAGLSRRSGLAYLLTIGRLLRDENTLAAMDFYLSLQP